MIKQLVEKRTAKAKDQRFGNEYNFGAKYFDARDETLRPGDRTVGTEHLVLALLVDPGSPAAKAIHRDLEAARSALDEPDNEALSSVGTKLGVTPGP